MKESWNVVTFLSYTHLYLFQNSLKCTTPNKLRRRRKKERKLCVEDVYAFSFPRKYFQVIFAVYILGILSSRTTDYLVMHSYLMYRTAEIAMCGPTATASSCIAPTQGSFVISKTREGSLIFIWLVAVRTIGETPYYSVLIGIVLILTWCLS